MTTVTTGASIQTFDLCQRPMASLPLPVFQKLTWRSEDVNKCTVRGKNSVSVWGGRGQGAAPSETDSDFFQDECYNYVKVLVPRDDETLFACGTNAFNPTCRNYKAEQHSDSDVCVGAWPKPDLGSSSALSRALRWRRWSRSARSWWVRLDVPSSRVRPTWGCSPVRLTEASGHAHAAFCSLIGGISCRLSGGDFYSATMTDFLASDAVIYRSLGDERPVLRTVKYDSKWLRGQ